MAKKDFLDELRVKTEHKQKAHLDWMIKSTADYVGTLKKYKRQKGLVSPDSLLSSIREHNSALITDAIRYINESMYEKIDISQMLLEKQETIGVVRSLDVLKVKEKRTKLTYPKYRRSMLSPYSA